MKKSEEEPSGSDKGWAWIVLGAAFTNSMLLAGYMQGIGVFFVAWQDDFGASAKDVGWIGVIVGFCTAVGALMGGALSTKLTCQKIIVFFGLVFAASIVSGSFTTSMWQLYITNLASGLSLGLCLQPGWTAIGYHFSRWLGLANGLSSAGVGMGIVVLPPLYQFFAELLGWRGALQVTGAMMVMCSVCGILIRPTRKEHFLVRVRKNSMAIKKDERRQRCSVTLDTGVVIYQVSLFERLVRRPLDTFTEKVGLQLLVKYPRFLIVCIANSLVGYSYYSGMVFFQSKVVYENGIHRLHASFLLSAIGVGSIVGRVGSGFLVDFKVLSPRVLYGLANLSCSLFSFTNPFVGSYPMLLAISIWFGLFSGLSYSLVVFCCRLCVPAEDVSTSIGMVLLSEGVGVLFGVFLVGLVRDLTSSYSMSFVMCGGFFVLSGLVVLLESFYVAVKERRRRSKEREEEADIGDNKGLATIPEDHEEDHGETVAKCGAVNSGYHGERKRRSGVAAISTGVITVQTTFKDLAVISEEDVKQGQTGQCVVDVTARFDGDHLATQSNDEGESVNSDEQCAVDVCVTDAVVASDEPTQDPTEEMPANQEGEINMAYDKDVDDGPCVINIVSTSDVVVPTETEASDHVTEARETTLEETEQKSAN